MGGRYRPERHQLLAATILAICFLTSFIFSFPPPAGAEELAGQLNINTATAEELRQLPFVGENKAAAIIDYRQRHGPFTDLTILVDSAIIGQKSYEAIRPYLTLNGPSRLQYIGRNENGDQILSTHDFRSVERDRPGEVRGLADGEYYETLVDLIDNAHQSIHVAMFLFKISDAPDNRPATVLDRLVAARRRGVEVEVQLEDSGYEEEINSENRRVANILTKNDIQVAFDSPQTTTHVKMVVIDQRYLMVGSHNLTHAALANNHEFSLLVDNRDLAREALAYLHNLPQQ
jgi:competence ComEA-like helix-hairpin-helix protein